MPLYFSDVTIGQKFRYMDMPDVEFLRIPDLYDPFSKRTYDAVRLDAKHTYDGFCVLKNTRDEVLEDAEKPLINRDVLSTLLKSAFDSGVSSEQVTLSLVNSLVGAIRKCKVNLDA